MNDHDKDIDLLKTHAIVLMIIMTFYTISHLICLLLKPFEQPLYIKDMTNNRRVGLWRGRNPTTTCGRNHKTVL